MSECKETILLSAAVISDNFLASLSNYLFQYIFIALNRLQKFKTKLLSHYDNETFSPVLGHPHFAIRELLLLVPALVEHTHYLSITFNRFIILRLHKTTRSSKRDMP